MTRRSASHSLRLLRLLLGGLAAIALALGLAGCFGAVGDICQVASDCNTGLVCCKRGDTFARGVCATSTTECTAVGVDAGTPPPDAGHDSGTDAGPADGSSDAASDTGTVDAGDVDAGGDAGTPDAGAPDAGTTDAGAPDAGSPDAGDVDAGDVDAGDVDAG